MKELGIEPTIGEGTDLHETTLGAYTDIGPMCRIYDCSLGDYTYCAGYNQFDYAQIGKFCSIATYVRINPGNHPTYTRVAQHHFTYRSRQFGLADADDESFFGWRKEHMVIIGNDVWIGHNAVILPGVHIGDGAAIGAGAIVTHDVEPYGVAVGTPARVIRHRFDEGTIRRIQSTRWWDWDHETLKARLGDFKDIERFLQRYGG